MKHKLQVQTTQNFAATRKNENISLKYYSLFSAANHRFQ